MIVGFGIKELFTYGAHFATVTTMRTSQLVVPLTTIVLFVAAGLLLKYSQVLRFFMA